MIRTFTHILITVCIITLCGATSVSSQLLQSFIVEQSAFSPDGDGYQETAPVNFTLSEDSPELSVIVYESDSVSVVDTLIAPAGMAAGINSIEWDGTYFHGGPVPDGLYIVALTALGTAEPDTLAMLPVAVDKTAPSIAILGAEPGIYTPGLMGTPQEYTATVVLSNTSPTYGLPHLTDQFTVVLTGPDDKAAAADSMWMEPEFEGAAGTYAFKWYADADKAIDGLYTINMKIDDMAGHSSPATQYVNVDIEPPEVEPVNIEDGATYRIAPDTLHAWAWDRNGIDSIYVKLSDSSDYVHVDQAPVVDDTARFAVRLTDALADEGKYGITFRVKDAVAADTGHVTLRNIQVTVDRSAPSAPTLTPFNGVSQNSVFTLTGSWTGSPYLVRIYNNGVKTDSVYTLISESLEKDVTLAPGENIFTATSVDPAGNESAPSNEVIVRFDDKSGLFIPAPFVPGDNFILNLNNTVTEVKLRLYDLSGELVVVIERYETEKYFTFSWDGINGSNDSVKKGPLVAVAEVFYEDGTSDVFREIFLYDPDN